MRYFLSLCVLLSVAGGPVLAQEEFPDPVAYWSFDQWTNEDGPFGQVADDGTLVGAATLSPAVGVGLFGGSVQFDEPGAYVSLNSSADLTPTQEFTIAGWLRIDERAAEKYAYLVRHSSNTIALRLRDEGNINVMVKLNDGQTIRKQTSGGPVLTVREQADPDAWTFFAVIFKIDGTTGEMYIVIGDARGSALQWVADLSVTTKHFDPNGATIEIPSDGEWQIGPSDTYAFRGNIDEVRFFDRALELNQLENLMRRRIDVQVSDGQTSIPVDPCRPGDPYHVSTTERVPVTKTFTIKNTGYGKLVDTTASISGQYFSITGAPSPEVLLPGSSTSIVWQYAPQEVGAHQATLSASSLYSDIEGNPETWQLNQGIEGTAVAAPKLKVQYRVKVASIDYVNGTYTDVCLPMEGQQGTIDDLNRDWDMRGGCSQYIEDPEEGDDYPWLDASFALLVSNVGGAPLVLPEGFMQFSNQDGQWSHWGGDSLHLEPGESQLLVVRALHSQAGTIRADISIVSNDPDGPLEFTLTSATGQCSVPYPSVLNDCPFRD